MSEGPAGRRLRVYLDITRLLRRAARPTLSGIDRIHIAYANHFLANPGYSVRFVACLRAQPRIIPTEACRRFVADIERSWRNRIEPAAWRRLPRLADLTGIPLQELVPARRPLGDNRIVSAARFAVTTLLASLGRRVPPPDPRPAIYLNPSHEAFRLPAMRDWFRAAGIGPAIFFVHDLIPVTHPEYFDRGDAERHAERLQAIASIASTLLVNSDFTRAELRAFLQARRLRDVAIEVMPFGVGGAFLNPPSARRQGTAYFVCLGIIEPRKNHVMLLQVWRRLAALLGPEAPKLVLIGPRGTHIQNVIAFLERSTGIGPHVIECGPLPDGILATVMAGARALLYPSMVEGFGLPILEALSLGTPVICSDIPPFRQAAGDVADFLDPLDGIAWLDAIMDYALASAPRRAAQRARIAHFHPPRWEDHFASLDRILGRPPGAAAWPS